MQITSAAFYYLFLGLLTFIYLICSIRTNVCLFSALFLLVITFSLVAGAFFQIANGAHELAEKLLVVSQSLIDIKARTRTDRQQLTWV